MLILFRIKNSFPGLYRFSRKKDTMIQGSLRQVQKILASKIYPRGSGLWNGCRYRWHSSGKQVPGEFVPIKEIDKNGNYSYKGIKDSELWKGDESFTIKFEALQHVTGLNTTLSLLENGSPGIQCGEENKITVNGKVLTASGAWFQIWVSELEAQKYKAFHINQIKKMNPEMTNAEIEKLEPTLIKSGAFVNHSSSYGNYR